MINLEMITKEEIVNLAKEDKVFYLSVMSSSYGKIEIYTDITVNKAKEIILKPLNNKIKL